MTANVRRLITRATAPKRNHDNKRLAIQSDCDVTFQEDQSRIRCKEGIFAQLRSFAYNILRRNRTSTFSQARYAASLARLDTPLKWIVS